ncbi:MAG: hypothetical protein M3128_05730 [Verrucomicrobiota bacterium]|nr:hypothetical protein [Verrucomicrobiota bacterium]
MATKKKTSKKPEIAIRDLKAKKDAKGGGAQPHLNPSNKISSDGMASIKAGSFSSE